MSFSAWLLASSLLLIIIMLILGIVWWERNKNIPTPNPPITYNPPAVWSDITPGPSVSKNTCQLYKFPTVVVDIDNKPTVIPGTPTFFSEVLDAKTGINSYPKCLDVDNVMAQQVQRECVSFVDIENPVETRCISLNGEIKMPGENEVYYTNLGCYKVEACPGELSLVSPNFQDPDGVKYCLEKRGKGEDIVVAVCDPTSEKQLFRITRTQLFKDPNSLQPGRGQDGFLSQILDRDTNLCVVPGKTTTTTTYLPSRGGTGCTGPTQSITGPSLTLGDCEGGKHPGYIWGVLPSVYYCPEPSGCFGCTGCTGTCEREPGTAGCTGCQGCTGYSPLPVPPQLVNLSGIDVDDIPIGATGYGGLTGISASIKYLIDNGAQSMYYGGQGSGIILKDIGTDAEVCTDKAFITQYFGLANYNTISNQNVCIQGEDVECVPL